MTKWKQHPATEEQEQAVVAQWLEWHNVVWFHPPNEGRHKPAYRKKQRALGMKRGVPDIMVVQPPPRCPDKNGLAIELKRTKGGQVSAAQHQWLDTLKACGWVVAVCRGADAAIELLEKYGYGGDAK